MSEKESVPAFHYNFTARERAALGYLVGGLLVGVVALIADLIGAPSWWHAVPFLGAIAFGWGIVMLVQSDRERRKGDGIVRPEEELLA